jgi:hypothetical protein
MVDPEGNAFCILPSTGADIDRDGRAHYRQG